ncbi:MAG: CRISPR-associated helicase Cas3' [candidate division Zixibacteria bacterium]|jgi:CRISPR-associated endonuclease/helicase Cas3|nr:CRISPR-associated helicase Cas3' [candidate division Zixibacteria bacterium]
MFLEPAVDYYNYWAKASRNDAFRHHLLPYHLLDVVAVGDCLLDRRHPASDVLTRLLRTSEEDVRGIIRLLMLVHDIGKFCVSFQGLVPELAKRLLKQSQPLPYTARHDLLGLEIWNQHLVDQLSEAGRLTGRDTRRFHRRSSLDILAASAFGHHGLPLQSRSVSLVLRDHLEESNLKAAVTFLSEALSLLSVQEVNPSVITVEAAATASWWVNGFITLCDWIASSESHFPMESLRYPLQEYLEKSRERASLAVDRTGILPARLGAEISLSDILGTNSGSINQTNLQQTVANFQVESGPYLFIIEESTGSGKTEAAALLAHRLMTALNYIGLYVALPTTATSDSMYRRLRRYYRLLYNADEHPTLVLSHGMRDHNPEFSASILAEDSQSSRTVGDSALPAGAACSHWLADHRKKALLAHVGVGTVDQALLAVLPSKHLTLRLLGLAGKVLIVDEVHACDVYMSAILEKLIQAHAVAGGSTILLSATLPSKQRERLVTAFNQGVGISSQDVGLSKSEYPLITTCNCKGSVETRLVTPSRCERTLSTHLLTSHAACIDLILETVKSGRCMVWIRNTVSDAQMAFVELRRRLPAESVFLLHARFTNGERLAAENSLIETFGPNSTAEQRNGRVVIATQVVEQSLDLDFDEMISDLAPIDLLIQRLGRMRRHCRDQFGKRVVGQDLRGPLVLHVHGPSPAADSGSDWYKAHFHKASSVYPNHAQLWLTAKLLQEKGTLTLPNDTRWLIESVYADDIRQEVPPGLRQSITRDESDQVVSRSIGLRNTIPLAQGYTRDVNTVWWDDRSTPTRLMEESTTILLCRLVGERLEPWTRGGPQAWLLSMLNVRAAIVKEPAPPDQLLRGAIEQVKSLIPGQCRWGVLLPMTKGSGGNWECKVIDAYGEEKTVHYSSELGFITSNDYAILREDLHEPD